MNSYLRVLLFVLLIPVAAPAHGQTVFQPGTPDPSQDSDKRYTLSGTVVNSVTGEPIRRAVVSMFGTGQASTMTDSDGHFEFADLPRSSVGLSAQKPGFFNEQQMGRYTRVNRAEVGPDTPTVTIRLVPEAVVFGRIVDTDGFPVAHLPVVMMAQKIVEGRKHWEQHMAATTDFDGQYRIYGLPPGQYSLIAGPGRQPALVTAAGDDTLEMGFPAQTYPASAGPNSPGVKLGPGQQLHVDLTMRAERFYSIAGSVSGLPPNTHAAVQLISGATREINMPARVDNENGIFQMPRVPRGDYVLRAYAEGLMGSVPISVRSNVNGVQVPLQQQPTIPVRIRFEQTSENKLDSPAGQMQRATVMLAPLEANVPPAYGTPEDPKDPAGSTVLRNVVPGRYRATITPSLNGSSAMYVASARYGNADLLNEDMVVTGGDPEPIDIVLRDDGPVLKVKAHSDDEVTAGFVVLLVVPEKGDPQVMQMGLSNGAGRPRRRGEATPVTTVARGADAEMQFRNFRPGRYTVLAFDDVNDLEYMDRDALAPYLSRGAKVTLSAGQESSASVNVIRRGGE